jgi:hypothetical protein
MLLPPYEFILSLNGIKVNIYIPKWLTTISHSGIIYQNGIERGRRYADLVEKIT